MNKLIVGNWKCNPTTLKEAKKLFDAVKKFHPKNAEVVICPPFVYLSQLKGLTLGAQNVFYQEKGAFTGEVSPAMLKDFKIPYVIIGHSERRKHFGETDELISKKIKAAVQAGLKVIFCIGENEGDEKQTVIEKQITEGLKNISSKELKQITIAYEPVWAIGTGKNCSVDETLKSVLLIKKNILNLYTRQLSDTIKVLYGGSVTEQNAGSYIKEAGVHGLLVGGASLRAEEFIKIVKSTT